MTIDEAKKLLPPELKYPLPIEVIDNLLGIQRIAIDMSEPDENGMHYALMAALIELKEKKGKCKWIQYDYRTMCPEEHDIDNPYWRIPETRRDVLKYCPYCGKEIDYDWECEE